jgi:uncharacterized protein (TIGR02284 family)
MALSTNKMIEELNELIRMDHDAIGAYQEAIDDIKEEGIRQQLILYRADHERHITELSAIVLRFGGTPPTGPDLTGAVRKTMTQVAGVGGTELLLKAMKSNEKALNESYAHHAQMDWPTDVLEVIERNFGDEQRHLAYIADALHRRLWEGAGAHP